MFNVALVNVDSRPNDKGLPEPTINTFFPLVTSAPVANVTSNKYIQEKEESTEKKDQLQVSGMFLFLLIFESHYTFIV